MYCQYCGKPVDDAAQFCTNCGKQKIGSAPAATPVSATERMASHLRIMGVLWLIYSGFRILMGVWTLVFSHYMLPMMSGFMNNEEMQPFLSSLVDMLHVFYGFTFVYSLVTGVVGLVAGWGLLQRTPWGRILAIIIAIGSVISIPFGTALAIYTFVILLASDGERNYRSLAAPA